MSKYQLAEINVAKMIGVDIEDPIMKEFVDNLDRVNELAESSPGFVWRLKGDGNNATDLNPYHDVQIIVNISVWNSIENLENYVFRTFHSDFLKRRKEWFKSFGKAYTAMWWIPEGAYPSVQEAVDRLDYLQKHGPTERAFSFRKKFPPPGPLL